MWAAFCLQGGGREGGREEAVLGEGVQPGLTRTTWELAALLKLRPHPRPSERAGAGVSVIPPRWLQCTVTCESHCLHPSCEGPTGSPGSEAYL